jgi:uncharacterized protein
MLQQLKLFVVFSQKRKIIKNTMNNKWFFLILTSILLLSFSISVFGQQKIQTEPFNFHFEGKKLSGFIDYPVNQTSRGIVILVPGSGQTNVFDRNFYYDSLSNNFVKIGYACVQWDKSGCGKSEGQFDNDQSMQNSSQEILAAIYELKHRNISGASKIGLWSISRGGYICPLVIQQYPSIAFWISVSGTDGNDSFIYLLECYLRSSGKSEPEIKQLLEEKKKYLKIFCTGGSYTSYLIATKNIRKEEIWKTFGMGWGDSLSFMKDQEAFIKSNKIVEFDSTNLVVFVPNFSAVLNTIHCPTLAIFGEKDCMVDWRKTKTLYEATLRKNLNTKLTIKTFRDGNHAMLKCQTGAFNEKLEKYEFCDNYIETIRVWLKEN